MCVRVGRQEPFEPVPRSTPLLLGDLVDAVDQDECLASGEYVIGPALRLRGGQGAPTADRKSCGSGRGPRRTGVRRGRTNGIRPRQSPSSFGSSSRAVATASHCSSVVFALCILSGQSRQHLARTLPDLQTDDRPADRPAIPDDHVLRWACRRCVIARTGATLPAQIWASVHDNVCTRHKLWVGQHVHAPEEQLDLSRTPDVVRAQQKYWRLRRHHGPALIDLCEELTAGLRAGLAHHHYRLVHRAETLHDLVRVKGPEVEPDRKAPWPTAAGFPERVALIHMFTSPHASRHHPHLAHENRQVIGCGDRVSARQPRRRPHTHRQLSPLSHDGTMHNEVSVHPDIQDHGRQRRPGT